MEATAASDGSAKVAALVTSDGRRDIFACKKGGLEVGKTKRGKGTKIMLLVDGRGVPVSEMTLGANVSEVHTIETLVDVQVAGRRPERLIYDRAADADWLRASLKQRGIELVCPHRRGRKKKATQDGRAVRRYRHRWIVERTISWLFNFKRLICRHEYHAHLFEGFVILACLMIVLRRF
jgi:transposase